jgi:hypothetical protein
MEAAVEMVRHTEVGMHMAVQVRTKPGMEGLAGGIVFLVGLDER